MNDKNERLTFSGLNAVYETRKNKDGKEYNALFLKIGKDYEKIVFLTTAELEILKGYSLNK